MAFNYWFVNPYFTDPSIPGAAFYLGLVAIVVAISGALTPLRMVRCPADPAQIVENSWRGGCDDWRRARGTATDC